MGDETDLIKRKTAWEQMLYWKMAVFKCANKAMIALVASITASLNGNEWSSFSDTQKFVAVIAAFAAVGVVIDAFLSTTMSDLQKDQQNQKPPLPPVT